MNTPNVTRISVTDVEGYPTPLTLSTDIVDYIESARTFGRDDLADVNAHGRFQRRMIAIPDRKSAVVTSMVLTISNMNGLYLVRKDEGTANSGWKLIDFGETFKTFVGSTAHIRSLGANWTDDDRITIAVAVDDGTANAPSRILVAYNLSSQTTDWEHIAWIDCGVRANVRIVGIRVLDEGDGTWTVVLAGDRGPDETLYLLKSNRPSSFAQALVFNPAVTMQEILDFETIVHPIFGGGLVTLGTSGATSVMAFRPFPKYNAQGQIISIPPVVPLPCPSGANVLEAGMTRNGGTDLYIGGQGLHLLTAAAFVNAEDGQLVSVVGSTVAPNVQDLVIADAADGSVAAWALLQTGDLKIVKRAAGASSWGMPLRLRGGVQGIAPVQGDQHITTSVLLVYTNGRAATVWQDATTGAWQESPLVVANPNQVISVAGYATTLRLLDKGGAPRPGVNVTVKASIVASVLLNNAAVFIGPNLTIETQTDFNGSVTLFDHVLSMTPAIYRFTIDGLKECIDVNPAGGMHERFKTVTPDELCNAMMTDIKGSTTSLLADNYRTTDRTQVDAVAGALNQMGSLASSASGTVAGVRLVDASADFSTALRHDAAPNFSPWAIQADSDGVRLLHDVERLFNAHSIQEFFDDLGETIQDLWEGIKHSTAWHTITIGIRAVVGEKGYEVLCILGDKAQKFIVNSLHEVGGWLETAWQWLKTTAEQVWDWLKLMFNWEDILLVRNAMVDVADETLSYLKGAIGGMKSELTAGIDQVLVQIDQWRAEAGAQPVKPQKAAAGQGFLDVMNEVTAPMQDVIDKITGNNVVSWMFNKLESSMDEIIAIDGQNPLASAVDAVEQFGEILVSKEVSNLWDTWRQLQADLAQMFDGKLPGMGELNFDTIKDVIIIAGDLLKGLIIGVRDLLLSLIDLLQRLIDVLHAGIFAQIRFPFIEKLVELVMPGQTVDTSFRLIDALMLLFAIPATIEYKLIFNKAPLTKHETITLPFGPITVQADGVATWNNLSTCILPGMKWYGASIQGLIIMKKESSSKDKRDLLLIGGLMGAISSLFETVNWIVDQNDHIYRATMVLTSFGIGMSGFLAFKKGWSPQKNSALCLPLGAIHFAMQTLLFAEKYGKPNHGETNSILVHRDNCVYAGTVFDFVGSGLIWGAAFAEESKKLQLGLVLSGVGLKQALIPLGIASLVLGETA